MSDEDANAWARVFDIAQVKEVLEASDGGIRHFRVQYYACEGVEPDCDPKSSRFISEEVQLNLKWFLIEQEDVIPWTAVANEQWVEGGWLWPPWREALRAELPCLHSTDPGGC